MSLQEMKKAVSQMAPAELDEFAGWLAEYRAQEFDAWDRQMEADAAAGKFDALIRQARDEHRAGQTTPLP